MPDLRKPVSLLGRAMIGGFLLQNAYNHFTQTKAMAAYAESKHIPMPKLAVLETGTMLAMGGASLLTGYRPKLGIASTALFLGGVSVLMHDFWKIDDPAERQVQQMNFMKNMAILGGALAMTAVPEPWPISIKTRRQKEGERRRRAEDITYDVESEYHAPAPT